MGLASGISRRLVMLVAAICLPFAALDYAKADSSAPLVHGPEASSTLFPPSGAGSSSGGSLMPVSHGAVAGPLSGLGGSNDALPALAAADSGGNALVSGMSDVLRQKAESIVTPDGLAAAMERGRGMDVKDSVAAVGSQLAQHAIDSGLRQMESKFSQNFFRTINLNWSPGFSGREDLYQVDSMISLLDRDDRSVMSQIGLQSRDGELGANIGAALRSRLHEKWTAGLNLFYDHLSDPDVNRWSLGAEVLGEWVSFSGNVYRGLDEETVGSVIHYSPDGWDLEFTGALPQLPWLEFSGRYYHWDRERQNDLKGQDYKLTLAPYSLLDMSLRYDDASGEGSDSEFGFEVGLSYQIGVPMTEQLELKEVGAVVDPWQRRFERVRREYEQRVQRRDRGPVGPSIMQVSARGPMACSGSSCTVTLSVGNVPSTAATVVVTVAPGGPVGPGLGQGGGLLRSAPSGGSGLLRSAPSGNNGLLRSARRCVVIGAPGASCDYDVNGIITMHWGDIGNANELAYSLRFSFRDVNGEEVAIGEFPVELGSDTARGVRYSTPVVGMNEGGTATYTVVLNDAPTGAVMVDMTSSDPSLAMLSVDGINFIERVTLIFEPSGDRIWSTEQTVTVRGEEDDDNDSGEADISYEVRGGGYDVLAPADQRVLVIDDDGPGVNTTAPSSLMLTENADPSTYTLSLRTQPSGTVTINIIVSENTIVSDSDADAVTVSPATMTFTTSNWGVERTVTLTAVDDDDAVYEQVIINYNISGGGYDDYTPASHEVTVLDSDFVAIDSSTGGHFLDPDPLEVTEDMSATYTVALLSLPTGTVTLSLESSDTSVAMVSPAMMTFTPDNWDVPQTVTVTGVKDDDAATSRARIIYQFSGANYHMAGQSPQPVEVADEDMLMVVSSLSGTALLGEGGEETYTLRPNTEPSGTVTVTLTLTSFYPSPVTVSPTVLEFTTENWDTAQTVTLTVEDDDDAVSEAADISYAISGGGYDDVTLDDLTVIAADDDTAGITSTGGSSVTAVEGGAAGTYTIVLDTRPSDPVTVTLASSDEDIATVSPETLIFNDSNWDMPRTVTVTAEQDDDATDENVTITYGVSGGVTGGEYVGVTLGPQNVTVMDDDGVGVVSSRPGTITVTEGGAAVTYNIRLATEPTGTVTIRLNAPSDLLTVAPPMLVFTTGNWDTARDVMVTAVQDDNASNENASISYSATGADYDGVALAAQSVMVDDDEEVGITSTGGASLSVMEGMTEEYTLVLDSQPVAAEGEGGTDTVTITLGGYESGIVTVAPTRLEFTPDNWDDAQTVRVTGTQDDDTEAEMTRITYMVSGADYDGYSLADQPVSVTDNDMPGLTSSQSGAVSVTEGGAVATYTLVLDTQPSGAVMVTLTSSDPSAVSVSPSPLTFTDSNWDMEQTVRVTAVQDDDGVNETGVEISYGISGADYGTVMLDAQDVTGADTAPARVTSTGGASVTAVEAGAAGTYTLVLDTQPTATVTVTLASSDDDIATVSPATLTFTTTTGAAVSGTTSGWNVAQTVTVTAALDDDASNEATTITHMISGGDYDSVELDDQPVTVTDNDMPGIVSSRPGTITVMEGGAAVTYNVKLATEPTGTVTIRLNAPDDLLTVSPTSLMFTTENWDTAQDVMVTAVDDTNSSDETAAISYSATGADYEGASLTTQAVMIEDDDGDRIISTGGASIDVTEGDTAEYTLVLNSEPMIEGLEGSIDTVTIELTSSDETSVTVMPASLEFTPGDWNMPQTVTLTGVDDTDNVSETGVEIRYDIDGGDTGYAGVTLEPQSVSVTDTDD